MATSPRALTFAAFGAAILALLAIREQEAALEEQAPELAADTPPFFFEGDLSPIGDVGGGDLPPLSFADILRGPYYSPSPEGGLILSDPLPGGHNEWDNQIRYVCGLYGMTDSLAPLYLKATIQVESAGTWNPRVRGDAGPCGPYRGDGYYDGWCSIGLMQVHRPSHPGLAASYDLRDGDQNLLAGGQVLAGAFHSWWPDYERVRAQYQGGPGGARDWPGLAGWNPVHANNLRAGVASVMRHFRSYTAAVGIVV